MKVLSGYVKVKTEGRGDYKDITEEIEGIVEESRVKNGIVAIHGMHTTAAIVIQERDRDVHNDTMDIMNAIVPMDRKYRHVYEGIANATAHIKNQMMGINVTIPVINGRMALGTWQRIFLVELFEKRERRVAIAVIGE